MSKQVKTLPYGALGGRTQIKTENPQQLKLQRFFKKIIDTSENAPVIIRKIEKRLRTTRRVRQPVKISKIAANKDVAEGRKTALVVAKVLDDERLVELPPMKIVALQWSKSVQKKIEAHGGEIKPLDQFITVSKKLENLQFIATDPNQRKSAKYWGLAPGEKGSTAYPRAYKKHHSREKRIRMRKPVQKFNFNENEE